MNVVQRLNTAVPEDIKENLLKGYINATLAWAEHDVPIWDAGYEGYRGNYCELLGNAYMQSQVALSENLQRHLASILQINMKNISDYSTYANEIVEMMPMNHNIREYMLEPVE